MGEAGLSEAVAEVQSAIDDALRRVEQRFDVQLASDVPPVNSLCAHVGRYRGKMLRPTLVVACGLAVGPGANSASEALVVLGAVCEMVHMATLVHDDVLDEADVRRRGATLNRLRGNEAAVLMGDYLIASAYHLCSQLNDQRYALLVGQTAMDLCAGELLQLHHRSDWSIDEATYFEILERKTGSLIGLACRLGAMAAGAGPDLADRLDRFGRRVGIAFQIQDDVLDLIGNEQTIGKSVGRDLAKGKLTLPLIHMLGTLSSHDRGAALAAIERLADAPDETSRAVIANLLVRSRAVEHAKGVAVGLVEEAKRELAALPESPAKRYLLRAADAAVARAF